MAKQIALSHVPAAPKRDCAAFWLGCCLPGATDARLAAFLRQTRNQQSLLLTCGVFGFWVVIPLYLLGVWAFTVGICTASFIFALGLAFDVLMIGESQRAAEDARSFNPALADALVTRIHWRWYVFAVNLAATGLTVVGCVYYFLAAAQPSGAALAAHYEWTGNAWFFASLLSFTGAFAFLAVDTSLMLHDVAKATSSPPPGCDELHLLLFAFFCSLSLLTTANGLFLLLYNPDLIIAAALVGLTGAATMAVCCLRQVDMQWRAFIAEQDSALTSGLDAMLGGTGGGDAEEKGVNTFLLAQDREGAVSSGQRGESGRGQTRGPGRFALAPAKCAPPACCIPRSKRKEQAQAATERQGEVDNL